MLTVSMSVKLGAVEVPSEVLQSVIAESSGTVSFSGALLPGEPGDWLERIMQMKGSTQRLQWRNESGGRTDIVHVEAVNVEEKESPDGKVIKRFGCRTRVVG